MLRKAHSAGNARGQRNNEIAKQNKKKNRKNICISEALLS